MNPNRRMILFPYKPRAEFLENTPQILFSYTDQSREEVPENVTHVIVDPLVIQIPQEMFKEQEYLVVLVLSFGKEQSLKEIGFKAFCECTSLENVRIPPSVDFIRESAFQENSRLVSVELFEGLRLIENAAFFECTSLAKIIIPDTVCFIGEYAFCDCYSLVDVKLPEGLRTIEPWTFRQCTSLAKISIPLSVEVIDKEAFCGCSDLTFLDLGKDGNLRKIRSQAFADCIDLRVLLIPSTVYEIEYGAFRRCTQLINVEVTEDLQVLGMRAFSCCKSLRSIALSARKISGGPFDSFDGCTILEEADDSDDTYNHLFHRFDHFPIHRLCYYQAYFPTSATLEKIWLIEDSGASISTIDKYGMTPFHFLAMSARPNSYLFSELQNMFPTSLMVAKDKWGKRPIDYLCHNPAPDSIVLIRLVIQATVLKRLKWLGLQRWRFDVSNIVDSLNIGDDYCITDVRVDMIYRKLLDYEWRETIALLEHIAWKFKLEDHQSFEEMSRKKLKVDDLQSTRSGAIDRQNCRINCGSDEIIANVLPFLTPPMTDE